MIPGAKASAFLLLCWGHAKLSTAVYNEVGIQMLNRELHRQIFVNAPFPCPNPRAVVISQEHLRKHGLDFTKSSHVPDVGFSLPPIQGSTIDEHFHRIGTTSSQPWLSLCDQLVDGTLPPQPDCWLVRSGWTRYRFGSEPTVVLFPCPSEQAIVFDVETMPAYGQGPVIAVAASTEAWYVWISPWLLNEVADQQCLVSFGPSSVPRLVVGHNVSYDRARIHEEYSLAPTSNRFIDTMALHIAVSGMTSGQRPAWSKFQKKRQEADLPERSLIDDEMPSGLASGDFSTRWEDVTSNNSLHQVAKLHCGIEVDKSTRKDFLTARPSEILSDMQQYITYCARDVSTTQKVFKHVFPLFRNACPSPVTMGGILAMGSSFLPVNEGWHDYIRSSEAKFRDLEGAVKSRLRALAENARGMMVSGDWKNDPWLSQMDWSPKKPRRRREEATGLTIQKTSSRRVPKWYKDLIASDRWERSRTLGHLLELHYDGSPVIYSSELGWHYTRGSTSYAIPLRRARSGRVQKLFSPNVVKLKSRNGYDALYDRLVEGDHSTETRDIILRLADQMLGFRDVTRWNDENRVWLERLNWADSDLPHDSEGNVEEGVVLDRLAHDLWPKWYWELCKPRKGSDPISLDISVRSRASPLLMKLKWLDYPLFFSREHGWIYRVPVGEKNGNNRHQKALFFTHEADERLRQDVLSSLFVFYKLPHKDGETENVGTPLGKTFGKYLQDGTLSSPEDTAKRALDLNAQCSYWISARDRVVNQMVRWHDPQTHNMGFNSELEHDKWGLILPQVVAMGTVTRRAIEKTWLTASNAKKDRVGSELKAMVRAPPGYAFVGADVDSEELWISSLIGDSQFGFHGSTAMSWMTLEGTKAAKTDLHSKTASILGITRDAAKIFNYSRIYGAGMRHAQQLLLQNNAGMGTDAAAQKAAALYTATKGKRIFDSPFGQRLWIGGSESYLFNKLEEMALAKQTETPVLGCRITTALQSRHLPSSFGSDFLPSRINWAVQSSGVDYLHLLIVAMDFLIKHYHIKARYLISIHDELRYLVLDQDKYRAALALQVANLWTRCQFAFRLGMDDLPQAVAFFSAVDIDTVLRKEVTMNCQTPSHNATLPAGEALDIQDIIARVGEFSFETTPSTATQLATEHLDSYTAPDIMHHRVLCLQQLQAQATDQMNEIRTLGQLLPSNKRGRKADSNYCLL